MEKRGKWADYSEAVRRMATYTVLLADVPVEELTLPMFHRALKAACSVDGRDPGTVTKIKPHVLYTFRRLHIVGVAMDKWEENLMWVTPRAAEDSLPYCTLNASELSAYLHSEDATLMMRCAVGLAYDVVNVRVGDLRAMTWEKLGAPDFDRVVVGNEKLMKKDDRVGTTTDVVRVLLRRYHAQQVTFCELKEKSLPLPFALGKDKWAKKLRKEMALVLGIKLGYEDNAGYQKNGRNPECGRQSFPAPEKWNARQKELLLGSKKFQKLRFHSSRTDFNARLAEVEKDPTQRARMTGQSAKVVLAHYNQKKQIEATQPNPVVVPQSLIALPES